MRQLFILITALILPACTMIDTRVTVVENFQIQKYLGTWYEIARLDHSFERNMNQVTATYSLDGDKVNVVNKGFNTKNNQWKEAVGKAYFIESDDVGLLKVSFFGPFYGAYQIHDLIVNSEGEYTAALVLGPDNTYAWILSRDPVISQDTRKQFEDKLAKLNVNRADLIWVEQ